MSLLFQEQNNSKTFKKLSGHSSRKSAFKVASQCKGLYKLYKGLYKLYKGLYKLYKGLYELYKGIHELYKSIYDLFKGIYKPQT